MEAPASVPLWMTQLPLVLLPQIGGRAFGSQQVAACARAVPLVASPLQASRELQQPAMLMSWDTEQQRHRDSSPVITWQ